MKKLIIIILLITSCQKQQLQIVYNPEKSSITTHQVIHLELMNKKAIDSIGERSFVLKLVDGYKDLGFDYTIVNSLGKANAVIVNHAPKQHHQYPYIIYPINKYGYEDPLIYVSWSNLTDTNGVGAWLVQTADSWRVHNDSLFNRDTKYAEIKIGWIAK